MADKRGVPKAMPERCRIDSGTLVIVCWFSAGMFLHSDLFVDVDNGVKRYVALGGFAVIFFWFVLSGRHFHSCLKRCQSWNLLKLLYAVGAVQAVYGIMQHAGVCCLHYKGIGIAGSLDNPAGFAAMLALLFPVGVAWFLQSEGRRRAVPFLTIVVYLLAVFFSKSRAGVVASVASGMAVIATTPKSLPLMKSQKLSAVFLLSFAIVANCAIYAWKPVSATGRLYIWNIAMQMVAEQPLCGYGRDGFRTHYMYAQAKYLSEHPESDYAAQADNIRHPYNEYIAVLVDYGVAGLSVFIMFIVAVVVMAWRQGTLCSSVVIAASVSFVVLSMFSYPLHYAPVWIVLAVIVGIPVVPRLPACCHALLRLVLGIVCVLTAYMLYEGCKSEMEWKWISDKSLCGYTEEMIPRYETLHKTTMLSRNGRFLYNYAAELNYVKRYDESLEILRECREYIFDYDVALLYADNMYSTCRYDSAIAYARLAAGMVPCRFIPYHYLLNAYNDKGDSVQASITAHEIIGKPVKVPSAKVEWVRCEAKRYLDGT